MHPPGFPASPTLRPRRRLELSHRRQTPRPSMPTAMVIGIHPRSASGDRNFLCSPDTLFFGQMTHACPPPSGFHVSRYSLLAYVPRYGLPQTLMRPAAVTQGSVCARARTNCPESRLCMFAVGCMRAGGYKGRGRSSGPSYLEYSGIKIRKFLE